MANDMSALFAAGQNVSGNNNINQRTQDELVLSVNAHAFFLAFGKPAEKCEHQFFTKKDGQSKLEGFRWNRPFQTKDYHGTVNTLFIGKNLAADGMGLKELAAELRNEKTTFEVHIRKGSDEAYISKPRTLSTGSADEFFED